jgi:hypothetical protein
LNIYYLRLDAQCTLFHAEDLKAGQDRDPPSGWRGWAERKLRALHEALHRTQGGVWAWLLRLWHWLRQHIAPDEAMLRRLRHVEVIHLHHPDAMGPGEVRAAWEGYLASRWWHHWLWFLVDSLLAMPSIALAALPGPNVVGYWLAFRAVSHGLALLGIRRARLDRARLELLPTKLLDAPLASLDDEARAHLADQLGLCDRAAFFGLARKTQPQTEDAAAINHPAWESPSSAEPTGQHRPG